MNSEQDYSEEVTNAFRKFQQGAVEDYRVKLPIYVEMDHIEAKILDSVALLHRDTFSGLSEFSVENRDYADPTLLAFDREI